MLVKNLNVLNQKGKKPPISIRESRGFHRKIFRFLLWLDDVAMLSQQQFHNILFLIYQHLTRWVNAETQAIQGHMLCHHKVRFSSELIQFAMYSIKLSFNFDCWRRISLCWSSGFFLCRRFILENSDKTQKQLAKEFFSFCSDCFLHSTQTIFRCTICR